MCRSNICFWIFSLVTDFTGYHQARLPLAEFRACTNAFMASFYRICVGTKEHDDAAPLSEISERDDRNMTKEFMSNI